MKKNKKIVKEGSSDPTRNAEDLAKDTLGMTGGKTHEGIEKSTISEKEYQKEAFKGMSSTRGDIDEELAEEPNERKENLNSKDDLIDSYEEPESPFDEASPNNSPENEGEQESTTSDPGIDDDTLNAARRAGFQNDETSETPEEIDAGRDIDNAEEYKRTH